MSTLKRLDPVRVVLAVLAIALAGLSSSFYYRSSLWEASFEGYVERYSDLKSDYLNLQETYLSLRGDYLTLQEMYSTLRNEYSDLQNRCVNLEREKMSLQSEYNEILHLEKSVVLEENRTFSLTAGGDTEISYDIPLAGYIEINFNASSDVYFWVGSSLTQDIYYARYPPFPYTAYNGTVRIPVCDEIHLHINNPNALIDSTVTMSITYTY